MFVSNHTFIVNKPEKMMESFKTIANLWIKFGAKSCRLMDLGGSGIGKMEFISVFDNTKKDDGFIYWWDLTDYLKATPYGYLSAKLYKQ